MALNNHSSMEMEYVDKLRDRLDTVLSDKMKQDTSMFIRFLRARNYNLDAAEIMLTNHISWRESHKVDGILSWYTPMEVSKYIPISFIGYDKEGSVVVYCNFGSFDLRGWAKTMTLSDAKNFMIHHYEVNIKLLEEQSKKLGKKIENFFYIVDCENLSLRNATHKPSLELIGEIVSLFDANYPERLKQAILCNTSFVFQLAYALIKPLMSGPTIEKIKIFGKTGWQEELQKCIDYNVLPAFLGGNCTDPDGDPQCKTFVKQGGIIPEHLYLSNQKKDFGNQSGVKKITINRLSKKLIELAVIQPNSDIDWEFEVKDKNIFFCLLFKEFNSSDDDLEEVIPKQRFDASVETEVGVYKCKKPGIYFMEFDNSYSWIYQKEVYYKAQVVPSKTPNINFTK